MTKQGLVITSVFAGSPAANAGLKPGDVIVTVDGQPTADAAIEASIARIKGKEGTHVTLGIKPKAGGPVEDADVVRRSRRVPRDQHGR